MVARVRAAQPRGVEGRLGSRRQQTPAPHLAARRPQRSCPGVARLRRHHRAATAGLRPGSQSGKEWGLQIKPLLESNVQRLAADGLPRQ